MNALIFTLGIGLLRIAYHIAAWFNPKARHFRDGRIYQADALRQAFSNGRAAPLVWFHCASLGEFEQGRPVIEGLKASRPDIQVLLTFFSPSGYEVRKDYALADHVFYLPWDTHSNALWFAREVRPALAVFVKYEFWFHYSRALKEANIPLISISAIFRSSHIYFKPYGFPFRSVLRNFSFYFVQNKESLMLLQSIGIEQATVAGDTRFDRVAKVVQEAPSNELANEFKGQHKVMVIGSAWPEDMHILIPFMNSQVGKMKFIVAPHEISESFMSSIEGAFTGRTMRYLQGRMELAASADLLMVDTIGLLAQLYRYGEFAFVGGGFKQGLHNTLEAACYGIPVFFGGTAPYDRYQEAIDLVALKGAFAITNTDELANCYEQLAKDPEAYRRASSACGLYVKENQGATGRITEYLVQILNAWKAE